MSRYVRFEPVHPTKTANTVFYTEPTDGEMHENTLFRSGSRQIINNVYTPCHNMTIRDNEFWPTRFWKNGKKASWTKWSIRLYDVLGMLIEHNHFHGREIEHKVYLNVYGDVTIVNNYFRDSYSQAVQTVFRPYPHHGTTETSDPFRRYAKGKIRLINNLAINCGHVGYHYFRGSGQSAGFTFSQHRCIQEMEVYYHGNHLIQRGTGPFKYSGGMAHSFGAIMAEHKAYTEGIGNLIDYKQPSDRPVIQLDSNRADYWVGNTLVQGGKVKFINPNDLIWKNNKGHGVVMLGKVKLGPITGSYEFRGGERVK